MRYIYLLRHGNPGNGDDLKRCLGSTDVCLSAYGRKQIEESRDFINKYPWQRIYSSPMRRCVETAQCLGIKREELILKENLQEMEAGIWENLTFREIKERYPELYKKRGKHLGTFAVQGAESFEQAGKRFTNCLSEIRTETEENILVIAHAGVIRGCLCTISGKDYDQVMDYSIPYGSITILREDKGELEIIDTGLRSIQLLNDVEINRIYKKCMTPDNVIRHMKKVAEVAVELMRRMLVQRNQNNHLLSFTEEDIHNVHKAALLHDIYRLKKDHAQIASDYLRKEGYKELAELVALHHSVIRTEKEELTLHEILFYADKCVENDKVVSIEERFCKSFEKCRGIEEAVKKHMALYKKTKEIERKIMFFHFIESTPDILSDSSHSAF